jgi:hypothetical protein
LRAGAQDAAEPETGPDLRHCVIEGLDAPGEGGDLGETLPGSIAGSLHLVVADFRQKRIEALPWDAGSLRQEPTLGGPCPTTTTPRRAMIAASTKSVPAVAA